MLELLQAVDKTVLALWLKESGASASDTGCLLLAIVVAFKNAKGASECFSVVIEEFQAPPSSWLVIPATHGKARSHRQHG